MKAAKLECHSSQSGVQPEWVEIENIDDAGVANARANLDAMLRTKVQVSDAVAQGYHDVVIAFPKANPSDLWQHVIYRHLLATGWSDQRWKRVSGFALERALVALYNPYLAQASLRLRILTKKEADQKLAALGVTEAKASKVDLFIEGLKSGIWHAFGAAHVKSSIAERIQDDVPASSTFMDRGLTSIALTMDAKSYPPPHGNCVNYGELGGRSMGVDKERIKRDYIEATGQFDGLFSFNLRTPPSPANTASGKKIFTLPLPTSGNDELVQFLSDKWSTYSKAI